MRRSILLLSVLSALLASGCQWMPIRVPLHDGPGSARVWQGRMEPEEFLARTGPLPLSFDVEKLGAVPMGPAVEFGKSLVGEWNDGVARVNRMYLALCEDWNEGAMSVEFRDRRLKTIESLYALLVRERPNVNGSLDSYYKYWTKEAEAAFAATDRELARQNIPEDERQGAVELKRKLVAVATEFYAIVSGAQP